MAGKLTKTKLTKRSVDAAAPRSSRYVMFDSEIRGFGLRVFPSGQKSWVFEYKGDGGGRRVSTKRVTIGRVDEFTPDEARKIADRLRSQAKVGLDPQAEKSQTRNAPTVSDLISVFLEKHVATKRKASTSALYDDILNRIAKPALGKRKAKDVTRADLAKLHLEWSHTPFQANRVLAVMGSMYTYAGRHGLVPENFNPAKGVEKYAESARERLLSTNELERLGESIRLAESSGVPWLLDSTKKSKHVPKANRQTVIGEHAAAALRLLIFTGARLREILHLEWSHVDLERGLLLLPDSKTGKKTIILNAPAMELLAGLTRVGRYVIAGDAAGTSSEKPRADLKRPWTMVKRHAGLDDLRIHDLRHNFASFGAGGGMGLPIIGKLLGHTQAATTQRYAHLDADPLRRASNAIAASIAAAMGEGPKLGDVVVLRSKKNGQG